MANKIERRFFNSEVQERAAGNADGFDFGGLASSTGVEYTMYEDDAEIWTEEIAPGAFDEVLDNDVRALVNHDASKILGRTKNGTAKVWTGANGLEYAWKNPDTSYAADVAVSIKRGDINQSSFGFSTNYKNNKFEEFPLPDGRRKSKRTILKIDELFDVSPVTFPANPDTEVGKRDFETALKEYRKHKETAGASEPEAPAGAFDETEYRELELQLKEKFI